MNFIQTFHIHSKDLFHDAFGWSAPEYHLMGWSLSCLQLHKLYGNITLFANSQAAHLLIDTLQLPYTKVNLTHDKLALIHSDLWALSKIYTYSLQKEPFLHIDGDVFLFNPLETNLFEGELIAQNIEVATENYYTLTQKTLMRCFTFFPACVKRDFDSGVPIQAANAGILGGKNVSFFHDYSELAFEYVRKNADLLKHINVDSFNVFFEQHLFYALAKEKRIPVSVLFKSIIKDNGYKHLGDFHDVPSGRSYLHLLGPFKKDELTCIQMAAKLKELYPVYYERIIALFHDKNLRLSPSGFLNNRGQSKKRIQEEYNTHLRLLKSTANNCPTEIDEDLFHTDFELFYYRLVSLLTEYHTNENLYKRDSAAQHWYADLFTDASVILDKTIVRSKETEIIESSFNWAGLFNKHYRVGLDYYKDLQITKGSFLNLVVYEASDNGFSLYDIDELEHAILLLLSEPLSINEILNRMRVYFEEDVLQNYYEDYKNIILISIKQLVIKKAIQPL